MQLVLEWMTAMLDSVEDPAKTTGGINNFDSIAAKESASVALSSNGETEDCLQCKNIIQLLPLF